MKLHTRWLAPCLALLLSTPAVAQPRAHKVDQALTEALSAGCEAQQVIIRTRPGYRGGLAAVLKQDRRVETLEHPTISAVTAQIACEDIDTLSGFDEVLGISIDAPVLPAGKWERRRTVIAPVSAPRVQKKKKLATLSRPSYSPREAFSVARADRSSRFDVPVTRARDEEGRKAAAAQSFLWETLGLRIGTTDAPEYQAAQQHRVGVAIIDSGIEPSADFNGRISHFYDFTSGRPRKANPSDGYGHGTHIAGLIGSAYVGLAPQARLVGLKVLNNAGQGRTSDVIQAIEFAIANREALGIRVINLSLGHPVYEEAVNDPLVQAVEAASRAGLVVIAAAGNVGINPATGQPGYAGIMSPGNAPSAITVGALQTGATPFRGDDAVAPYSSRGPTWFNGFAKPDVVAPGHNLLSVAAPRSHLRRQHEQMGGRGEYMRLSGTSMASGVTSGLAALVLGANPNLTPNALKMALQFTAIPVKTADALTQGTGGVNGQGALELAGLIDTSMPKGYRWLTGTYTGMSSIGGELEPWAGAVIWDGYLVSGEGVVSTNHGVWDRNIVWGTFHPEWDNIVWGTAFGGVRGEVDNIVWGTFFRFAESDNIVWGTNFIWRQNPAELDNIVWGTMVEEDNIVWGTNVVWGTALLGYRASEVDNIVWGTEAEWDNIVWGTDFFEADNIVWGTLFDLNLLKAASRRPDIGEGDNIVWGTGRDGSEGDNIVWGTSVMWGDTYIIGVRANGHRR